MDGFGAQVDELRQAAEISLPDLSTHLEAQAKLLTTEDKLEKLSYGSFGLSPEFDWMARIFVEYQNFVSDLAIGIRRASKSIDDTAHALDEIVKVYRRADGQA
jgi:hypothetical protein